MIQKEHLDHFHELKTDPNFEASMEVKQAYVIFLRDFCKYCSTYWNSYLKQHMTSSSTSTLEKFGFRSNLTISDEAIGIWLIKHNYDTAYNNSLEIQRLTLKKWKEQRVKRKQGKHDSKVFYNEYKQIFNKIKEARSDKETLAYWESVFFDGIFHYTEKSNSNEENYAEFDDHDDTFEAVDVLEI